MHRLRGALVTVEIAGTLVLLVGCGLMVRSVWGMVTTELGVDTNSLVRGRLVLRARNYRGSEEFRRFYDQVAERITTLAGSQVIFTDWPPFAELRTASVQSGAETATAGVLEVSSGYFPTLRVQLLQGREFSNSDRTGTEPVAMVSDALARRLWPGVSPLGQQLRVIDQDAAAPPDAPRTIVGIASNVRQTYADAQIEDVYLPFAQRPVGRFGAFYVRTARPTAQLLPQVRETISTIDPQATIAELTSVDNANQLLSANRFLTTLLLGFSAVAAFLAVLGIYGITAYAVEQREREVAIRMAIGATGQAILRLFIRDAVILLTIGIAVGLFGAMAFSRVLENRLYGVTMSDLTTLLAAGVLMAVVGLVATWWPARRACLASPVVALNAGE